MTIFLHTGRVIRFNSYNFPIGDPYLLETDICEATTTFDLFRNYSSIFEMDLDPQLSHPGEKLKVISIQSEINGGEIPYTCLAINSLCLT